MIAGGEMLFARAEEIPSEDFLSLFRGGAGSAYGTPEQLPEELMHGVELLKRERPSWEAEIPLETLAAADFPVLVLSGGHSPAFEAVCNSLARSLFAEREVIEGRGHTVPSTGAPYNERLEAFMRSAERY
jgi:pimeloyl-ACP methyl ester carboxylesterase